LNAITAENAKGEIILKYRKALIKSLFIFLLTGLIFLLFYLKITEKSNITVFDSNLIKSSVNHLISQSSATSDSIGSWSDTLGSISLDSQANDYNDPQSWHCFHKSPLCQGTVFTNKTFLTRNRPLKQHDFKKKWTFNIDSHVYSYIDDISVFSKEPVVFKAGPRMLAAFGCYDGSLYALDIDCGEKIWEFTAGAPIMSTPLVWHENENVFIAFSTWERSIYILNGLTGKPLFKHETMKFSFGLVDTYTGDPCFLERDQKKILAFPIFLSKRESLKYIYEGNIVLIDAHEKKFIKNIFIAKTRLTSLASLSFNSQNLIIGATHGGLIYAVDPWSEKKIFSKVLTRPVTGGPALGFIKNSWKIITGDSFGLLHSIDLKTHKIDWKYKTGMIISSAPAVMNHGNPLVAVGANDREFYLFNAETGKKNLSFQTKNFVSSSAVFLKMKSNILSAFTSMDGKLYLIDINNKNVFFKYACGDLLWPYVTTGMTIWSNPVFVIRNNRIILVYCGMDGRVHAFESEVLL
jgi:outer membrane protein assembly factor BamB